MLFKQIKQRGDNFSYLIADEKSKEAAIVDPSFNGDAIIKQIETNGLTLKYIINTHSHSDHIGDNETLRTEYGAKIVAHESSSVKADMRVRDNDALKIGDIELKIIHTPGHTHDGICLLFDKKVLTGDTLFVGECGRTDIPGSDPNEMYNSLFSKLMKLDDDIEVYPGHDYGSKPHSTIGEEKKTNYVLERRTLEEFLDFMGQP